VPISGAFYFIGLGADNERFRETGILGVEALADAAAVGMVLKLATRRERPLEGKVIAVGSGKRTEDGTLVKLDVKAGDRILFGKYAGTEIKVDGVEHIILREDEVLGVIG